MHGVAERIEDRRDIAVDASGRAARRWSSATTMYSANAPGRLTPMPLVSLHRCRRPARQLRQRPQTTWPSPLTMSPGWKSATLRTDRDDLAHKLVTHHHRHGNRLLGPGVPVVDVHVGAADAGAADLDQHVVDADLRFGDVLQPQPGAFSRLTNAFIVCSSVQGNGLGAPWHSPLGLAHHHQVANTATLSRLARSHKRGTRKTEHSADSPPPPNIFATPIAQQPPWEIGHLQPAWRLSPNGSRARCSTPAVAPATCALYFAERGHDVYGSRLRSGSDRAGQIQGRRTANWRSAFLVLDALALSQLPRQFDNVIDCGLFHVLDDADRANTSTDCATCWHPVGACGCSAGAIRNLPNPDRAASRARNCRRRLPQDGSWKLWTMCTWRPGPMCRPAPSPKAARAPTA